MNRLLRILLPVTLVILVATALAGLSVVGAAEPGQETVAPAAETAAPDGGARWTLDAELQASRDAYRRQLEALNARFVAAADQAAAQAILREIEALKINDELAVLEIQARRARERGDEESARQLEEIVAQVRAVTQVPAPATAPAR
jgi:hypothetical protein